MNYNREGFNNVSAITCIGACGSAATFSYVTGEITIGYSVGMIVALMLACYVHMEKRGYVERYLFTDTNNNNG